MNHQEISQELEPGVIILGMVYALTLIGLIGYLLP